MRVTFFGTYDEERHPRVRVLRQGLAANGAQVSVINRPLGDSTADRVMAARNPLQALKWIVWLLRTWARLLVRRRDGRRPDAVIVGYLGVLDVFVARCRWPRSFIVLDHMAPLAGVAADRLLPAAVTTVFRLIDRAAEAVASLVIFDTPDNASLSRTPNRKRLVVPVGAPEEWFTVEPCGPPVGGTLDVIFFGLHTPLQGTPTIGEAIGRLAGAPIRFTMVGTGEDLETCRALARSNGNVSWIDWVGGAELPSLVGRHHVSLGIFGTTPKAGRVVPNKIYQAGAAGCAIVTRRSPILMSTLGPAAMYVDPGSGEQLASALRHLADDSRALTELRRRATAEAESWTPERVTAPLHESLQLRLR